MTVLIIIILISLSVNLYFLYQIIFKKEGNTDCKSSEKEILSDDEVEKLKIQLDLLKAKNNSLEFKVEELNIVIKELSAHKKYLSDNIEKLEKLQKEKEEICAIAAHDIKNPAGTIKNLVKLLDTYDLTATEQKQIHESLVSISSRIITLVDEFSSTIKRDVISLNLNVEKGNLNSLLDVVAGRYIGLAKHKQIEIVKSKANDLLELEFDHNKVEEALENLVNNAIKFSPEGAKVELKSYINDSSAVVEVIDNGFGLSEEELQKAFNRGVTLSTKPTGDESSSGLGLWIVRRIIEGHGGRVWVKSKKGSGSTFAFRLPLNRKNIEQ